MKMFRILESEMLKFDELLEVSSNSSELSSMDSFEVGTACPLTADVLTAEAFDEFLRKTRPSSGENLDELSPTVEPPEPEKFAEPKVAPAAVINFQENFRWPLEHKKPSALHKAKKSALTNLMGQGVKRGKISSRVQTNPKKQGKLMVLVITEDYSPVRLPAAGLKVKELIEDYLRAEGIEEDPDYWEARLLDGKEPDFDLPPLESDQRIEDFRVNGIYLLRKQNIKIEIKGDSWSDDFDGFDVGSKFKAQNVVRKVRNRIVDMRPKETESPPPVVEDFHPQNKIGRDFFVIDIGTAQQLRKDTKDVSTANYVAEIGRRMITLNAVRITVPLDFRLFQLLGVLSSRKVQFLVTDRLCSTVFELFFSRDRLEIGSMIARIPNTESILVINQKFRRRNIRDFESPVEAGRIDPPEVQHLSPFHHDEHTASIATSYILNVSFNDTSTTPCIITVDAETVYHQRRRNVELLFPPTCSRSSVELPMEKSIGEILDISLNEFNRRCFTVIYSFTDTAPGITCLYEAPNSQICAELVAKLQILVKAFQANRKSKALRRNSMTWGSRDDMSRTSATHARTRSVSRVCSQDKVCDRN